MPIADIPELRNTSNAGLYAISPEPPSKKRTDFKMGRSVNIKKRLNDHHICFNKGYWIYCVLPLVKDLYHEDPLIERKKKILALTRRLETEMFSIVKPFMQLETTRTKKSEWFKLTNAHLRNTFQHIHEMFPNVTLPPICKWEEPFMHQFDDEGEQIEVSDVPIAGMTQGRNVDGKRIIKVKKLGKDEVYIK